MILATTLKKRYSFTMTLNKPLIAGALVALGLLIPILGATPPVEATQDKVWVCHAVQGNGELGNGYNLIHVDASAVDGEGHNDHSHHDGDIIPAPGGANSTCGAPTWYPPTPPAQPAPGPCEQQKIDKWTTTYNNGVWSAYTDWGDPAVWDDGRAREGHHGGTHGANGDRHFVYIVVDSREITTGDCGTTTTSSTTTTTTETPPSTSEPAPSTTSGGCTGLICGPATVVTTTTEPCSTGVTNETGDCEPVGTEYVPCVDYVIDPACSVPTTVNHEPNCRSWSPPCMVPSLETTTTAAVTNQLPATGSTTANIATWAAGILLAGLAAVGVTSLTRRRS